jgi:hypothetical protein
MIYYRDSYKLQLAESASFKVPAELRPPENIDSEFIQLSTTGLLLIRRGYAWDGASGPTVDRPRNQIIVPSLIHDVFCQLIRQRLLPVPDARLHADKFFHTLLRERGMNRLRAWLWYRGVRFDARHNAPKPKPILEAT